MGDINKPRILLVSYEKWATCSRLPKAFSLAGFDVAVCATEDDPVQISRFNSQRYFIPLSDIDNIDKLLDYIIQACTSYKPDFLLAVDEKAIRLLTYLYHFATNEENKIPEYITTLIVKSKGNPTYYEHTINKYLITELAHNIGIRVPRQRAVESLTEIFDFVNENGFPLVLKNAFGYAGVYVAVCKDKDEVEMAFNHLSQNGLILAQSYINGMPALTNASAYDGELLECAHFLKLKTYPDFKGPSSVVQHIELEEMHTATSKFIRHVGYSGIISLDFMLDDKNNAYLIECNPRPIPVSHLGRVVGKDIFKALYCALNGAIYASGSFQEKVIALFPKELARDMNSCYLYDAYHDVPWDEPRVLRFLLDSV